MYNLGVFFFNALLSLCGVALTLKNFLGEDYFPKSFKIECHLQCILKTQIFKPSQRGLEEIDTFKSWRIFSYLNVLDIFPPQHKSLIPRNKHLVLMYYFPSGHLGNGEWKLSEKRFYFILPHVSWILGFFKNQSSPNIVS